LEKALRMSASIADEAVVLLPALLLGIGLGLVYDLLSSLRHCVERTAAWTDVLFALLAGAAAFSLAMYAPDGRLSLWSLTAVLLGLLLQLHLLSGVKHLRTRFLSRIHLKKEKNPRKFRQKSTSKF